MRKGLTHSIRAIAAAAAVGLLSACQTPVQAPAWKLPDGVKTAWVHGYPMAYAEAGQGPTVVLVHGAMCDYRCFSDQQASLARGYRVISVSLRHFYPEPWDGSGSTFTTQQHVMDLAAFLEKVSPPVRLVGHSYGGLVASEVARARPELVARLVLAEGGTDGLLPTPSQDVLAGRQRFAATAAQTLKDKGIEAGLEFAVDTLNGQGAWSRFPPAVKTFHRDNAWTIVAVARDTSPKADCAGFGGIKAPTLLVTGQNTAPRYKQIVAEQAKCLPTASTVTIPGVGHAMMANRAAFEQALTDFLK